MSALETLTAWRGTNGSNPASSSEESANYRFRRVGIDASARGPAAGPSPRHQRYVSQLRPDEDELTQAIIALASGAPSAGISSPYY